MNEPRNSPRSRLYRLLKREVREDGLLDPREENERRAPSDPYSRMMASLETVFWVAMAAVAIYYTDFFRTALTNPAVNVYWFRGGLLLVAINMTIGVYLVCFVGYWKQIDVSEWEELIPWAVPVATASGSLSAVSLTVGLWPVWGFLTPLLLFVIIMGGMFVLSAIPLKVLNRKDGKGSKAD